MDHHSSSWWWLGRRQRQRPALYRPLQRSVPGSESPLLLGGHHKLQDWILISPLSQPCPRPHLRPRTATPPLGRHLKLPPPPETLAIVVLLRPETGGQER